MVVGVAGRHALGSEKGEGRVRREKGRVRREKGVGWERRAEGVCCEERS